MTISVIIPSHNNGTLLAKSLAGFVAQDECGVDWEIIVVDNNTSDTSIAALQLHFRDALRLTLVEQPKLKHPFALCRARNIGLALAQGTWIVVMDADIVPNRTYLKTLTEHIKNWRNTPTIATGERIFIDTNAVSADDIRHDPAALELLPRISSPSNYGLLTDRRMPMMRELPNIEHPWDYMHGCNVIFRREDALSINGYDEAYDGRWGFEDIDFAYRMIRQAGCLPLFAEGLQVYHLDLPESKSQTNRMAKSDNPNWWRICELIPGYREYKVAKYQQLGSCIKV